jgi:putative restriction endonuclease
MKEEAALQSKTAKKRDAAFGIGVRRAYLFQCAVCGSNLQAPDGQYEVQSAHIYPKSAHGSDDLRNGLCLCRKHHWAFDVGWISLSDDYRIIVRPDLPLHSDYDFIRKFANEKISFPADKRCTPHPLFMKAHRELLGFTS